MIRLKYASTLSFNHYINASKIFQKTCAGGLPAVFLLHARLAADDAPSSLFFWNYIIEYLHLRESTLLSTSLLPYAKCHKSFYNFFFIVDFFLFLLISCFFVFDFDFVLSCSCYLC
jgi:hypothetical protein